MPTDPANRPDGPFAELAAELVASDRGLARLARSLAGSDAAADDLLQRAWLAAQGARTTPLDPLAWLAVTLRRLAWSERRTESHRKAREHEVARAEEVAPADERLERLERRQLLFAELHALPEPYRGALIERWLEERTAAAIAARTGENVRSVETRLRRGLALLRGRLERRARGDRSQWFAALAARFPATERLLLLAMTWKQLFAVGTLLIALVTVVGWIALRGAAGGEGRTATADVLHDLRSETATTKPIAVAEGLAPSDESPRAIASIASDVAAVPTLRGRIVDEGGAPIGGALVRFRAADAPAESMPIFGAITPAAASASATSDADGRFRIAGTLAATGAFSVRASGCAPIDLAVISVPAAGRDLGDVVLARGSKLAGRVLDAAGDGVAGVPLRVRARVPEAPWLLAGTSEADGSFALDSIAPGAWELATSGSGVPPASVEGACATFACTGVQLVLPPSHTIRGRLVGAPAAELPPLSVRAEPILPGYAPGLRRHGVERHFADVGADGRFVLTGLTHGGDWELCLVSAKRSDPDEWEDRRGALTRVAAGDEDARLEAPLRRVLTFRAVDDTMGEAVEGVTLHALGFVPIAHVIEGGVHRAEFHLPPDGRVRAVAITSPLHDSATARLPDEVEADLGVVRMRARSVVDVVLVGAAGAALPGVAIESSEGALLTAARPVAPQGVRLIAAEDHGTSASVRVRETWRTDAAGRARIALRGQPRVTLVVEDPRHGALAHSFDASDAPTGEPIVLRMPARAALEISVTQDGVPLSHVGLSVARRGAPAGAVLGPNGPAVDVFTDERGVARVPALEGAAYDVTVWPVGGGRGARAQARFAFDPGAPAVEIALAASASLSGSITWRGEPLVGAAVFRKPLRGSFGVVQFKSAIATTGIDGRFALGGLEAGDVELCIEDSASGISLLRTVTLAPGANRVDVGLVSGSLSGVARDDVGEPVVGAELVAMTPSSHTPAASRAYVAGRAVTGHDGSFAFHALPCGVELTIRRRSPPCLGRRSPAR